MSPFTEKYIPLTYFFWKMNSVFIYLAGFSKPGKTVKRNRTHKLHFGLTIVKTGNFLCLQPSVNQRITPPHKHIDNQGFTKVIHCINNFSP